MLIRDVFDKASDQLETGCDLLTCDGCAQGVWSGTEILSNEMVEENTPTVLRVHLQHHSATTAEESTLQFTTLSPI
jgi:hypothetical protein